MNLLTPLGTTSNYSATANIHISLIPTAPAERFPACCVLTSRSLATASNSGDSSASRAQFLLSQPPLQNSCEYLQVNYSAISSHSPLRSSTALPTLLSVIPWAGLGSSSYSPGADPTASTTSNNFSIVLGVFTDPLPRNGSLLIRLLHSNGCTRYNMINDEKDARMTLKKWCITSIRLHGVT
jgi:hypothetical protein